MEPGLVRRLIRFWVPELQLWRFWGQWWAEQGRRIGRIFRRKRRREPGRYPLVAALGHAGKVARAAGGGATVGGKAQSNPASSGDGRRVVFSANPEPVRSTGGAPPLSVTARPTDRESMLLIAQELVDQEMELLSDRTLTFISVSPELYQALADLGWTEKTFGRAVWRWLDRELMPAVHALVKDGGIRRGDRIYLTMERSNAWVTTRSVKVPVPIRLAEGGDKNRDEDGSSQA